MKLPTRCATATLTLSFLAVSAFAQTNITQDGTTNIVGDNNNVTNHGIDLNGWSCFELTRELLNKSPEIQMREQSRENLEGYLKDLLQELRDVEEARNDLVQGSVGGLQGPDNFNLGLATMMEMRVQTSAMKVMALDTFLTENNILINTRGTRGSC